MSTPSKNPIIRLFRFVINFIKSLFGSKKIEDILEDPEIKDLLDDIGGETNDPKATQITTSRGGL